MCGIAGVVAWDDSFRIDRAILSRMASRIAHRGPDATDFFLNHEAAVSPDHPQCGFAFCRLSILDLDPRAMQPMTDGQRHLVFNGEIYNFRELRKEIDSLRPGYPWKTTGDSEVILRAFDCWGESCVDHFDGMFAFAIWEPAGGSLFLSRDRMGQKPLYYSHVEGRGIAFASELPALRELRWVSREVDEHSIGRYLQTGYIESPKTIYRNVHKLPPATRARVTAKGPLVASAYFDPNAADGRALDLQSLRTTILEAVRRQLVSDVPLGCFLSGGVDSSIIAAAMKQVVPAGQKILTFSIGFDDPRYDETKYAAAIAGRLGTEHRQFIVRPDAAVDLPKLAAVFGEPFGDSSALPTHYLARETRNHVKVALSGDGADELFGGYDRYRAMLLSQNRFLRPLGFLGGMIPAGHPKSRLAKAARFFQSLPLPVAERYAWMVSLFPPDQIIALLGQDAGRGIVTEKFDELQQGRDVRQTAMAIDRLTYLPEDILTKVDRASMLHALEVRSPFLSPDVVRAAANLTPSQLQMSRSGGSKGFLREAFAQDLPELLLGRPKMGFAVPIGQWLRTSLRPMLNDLLFAANSFAANHFLPEGLNDLVVEHHSGLKDHSQRLYALLMLELWWKNCGSCSE